MMNKPKRIQRKRVKGWKMPANSVYVGRPSRWRNPYKIGATIKISSNEIVENANRDEVVRAFELFATGMALVSPSWLYPLKGKNLVCWCPLDQPCHADILLTLANE